MNKRRFFIIPMMAMTASLFAGCNSSKSTSTFTVVWKNYNGVILETDSKVTPGTMAEYNSSKPTREMDETNKYEFIGWDKTIAPVSCDTVYTAKFKAIPRQYFTVYWNNDDGKTLYEETVLEGDLPSYVGADPTKDSVEYFHYHFKGWDKEITPVTGNTTYTATYDSEQRYYYTVTWKNYNGLILEVDEHVEKGTVPEFNGEAPLKQQDDTTTYTFDDWDKEVGPIEGDTVYTAVFAESPREYKIQWLNYDNSVLYEEMVGYGSIPEFKGDVEPFRESTESTDYEWTGEWDREIVPVDGNMVYKPVFQETIFDTAKIVYVLPLLKHEIINNNVTKVREGTDVELSAPTCAGYDFKGWFLDEEFKKPVSSLPNLSFDVTLYAKFEIHEYTITYKDEGEALSPNPTKITCLDTVVLSDSALVGHTFTGWKDESENVYTELDDICRDITLTAGYDVNSYTITLRFNDKDDEYIGIEYGEEVELEPLEKKGYDFLGWFFEDDPDTKFELETYTLTHDVTLIQKWSDPIEYDINYELNDDTDLPASLVDAPTKFSVVDLPELPVPTREGYDFAGWFIGDEEISSLARIYDDVTLEAKWVAKDVSISYDYAGGSLQRKVVFKDGDAQSESLVSPFESVGFKSLADKADAQFAGWVKNGSLYTFSGVDEIASDLLLQAKYVALPENAVGSKINKVGGDVFAADGLNYKYYQFTPLVSQEVTFESEGDVDVQAKLFAYGNTVEPLAVSNDISETNYNFSFKYTLEAYHTYLLKVESLIEESGNVVIKATSSLTAEEQIPTGTIKGGEYLITESAQKIGETFVSVGSPVKEGKVFGGWKDDAGNLYSDSTKLLETSIHLTAYWEDAPAE